MKKLFRALLCGAVLTASLCVSAFAAESTLLISPAPTALPEKQPALSYSASGAIAAGSHSQRIRSFVFT